MSFCGVVLYHDTVYGFGDSKASVWKQGVLCEDKRRCPAVKVFSNEYFVLSSYGAAEFHNNLGHSVFLDEWIPENINRYDTPEGLLYVLREKIIADRGAAGEYFGFDFGAADDAGPYIQAFGIQGTKLDFGSVLREDKGRAGVIVGGDGFYSNKIQCDLFAQYIEGRDDTEAAIREYAERLIKAADKSRLYNPAGGDITVMALRPVPHAQANMPEEFF